MERCNKCGAVVTEGALFCTECGAALTEPTATYTTNNPFEDLDNKVPKPEAASELIFGETVYDTAVQAELKADEAAQAAAAAAAAASVQAQAAAQEAAQAAKEEGWHGQTGYGKPAYGQEAQPQPEPAFDNTQQGAWSEKDQQAQQGWAPHQEPNFQNFDNTPQGWTQGNYDPVPRSANPSDKLWCALSYLWFILWFVAYFITNKNGYRSEFAKIHLSTALILNIVSSIAVRVGGFAGWAVSSLALIYAIVGIVFAVQDKGQALPPFNNIRLFK